MRSPLPAMFREANREERKQRAIAGNRVWVPCSPHLGPTRIAAPCLRADSMTLFAASPMRKEPYFHFRARVRFSTETLAGRMSLRLARA